MFAFAASLFNDTKESKGYVKSGLVATMAIGMAYAGAQLYRAKQHDNIPTLAPNDFHFLNGHLPKILSVEGNLYEWIYEEIKKMNWPKICALCLPGGQKMVFIEDPKLIKYLYEDQFEISIQKPKDLSDIYYDLLGKGIFVSNGARWKFHRKVAARMFSMRNLKDFMFDMSVKHSLDVMTKLNELIDQKSYNPKIGLDINNILSRFTLDTFSEIAFGQDIGSLASFPKIDSFGAAFDDLVARSDARTTDIFWKLKRMLGVGGEKIVQEDKAKIIQFVNDILDKKNLETENNEKISDVDGIKQHNVLSLYQTVYPNTTREELLDAALNFIIAGRDTTRLLLSWFIYELCCNENKEEIMKNLMSEVNVFCNNKEQPTYKDIVSGLKYLECALCETLRLYPVVPFNFKGCIKDVEITTENGNYCIRKGDRVLINHWSRNRDPKIFKNPLKFEPNRWKSKGVNTFDQYEYGVFNIAPRMCLGKSFAINEAKVFAYYFLKTFEFESIHNERPVIQRAAVLNMANGFYINLRKRE